VPVGPEVLGGKVRVWPGVEVSYLPQHHSETLPLHASIVHFLVERYGVVEFEARKRVGKFGISGEQALQPMRHLSGGQRVRVSKFVC
jgi:ATP-binding cassette subfamily F protein 3